MCWYSYFFLKDCTRHIIKVSVRLQFGEDSAILSSEYLGAENLSFEEVVQEEVFQVRFLVEGFFDVTKETTMTEEI